MTRRAACLRSFLLRATRSAALHAAVFLRSTSVGTLPGNDAKNLRTGRCTLPPCWLAAA